MCWMDYPSEVSIVKTKTISLIAVFSALSIAVGYGRGLTIPFIPGTVEFMTVIIFVSGFVFGWIVGAFNGVITLALYMLVPYPFAHPGAWLSVISPILLIIMMVLGSLYGIVGGFLGKRWNLKKLNLNFSVKMALCGLILTFTYDVLSSVGFFLAYPGIYPSIFDAIYLTFIPLWLPYPPIIHTVVNTLIFAIIAPPLIKSIKSFLG